MGYAEKSLQFPRGETANQSGWLTLTSTTMGDLIGNVFEVPDTVHGTGIPVKLRAVRLEAGVTGALKAMEFGSDALDFRRTVAGYADTAGAITKPLDELYDGVVLAQYDIVYLVYEGPTTVTLGGTVTAGQALSCDSSGTYVACTAGKTPSVIAQEGGDSGDDVVVYVLPGLSPADPAS